MSPSNTVTPDQVLEALSRVQDPDLHKDIVSLGFVTKNEVQGGVVQVTINLTTPACPVKDQMKAGGRRPPAQATPASRTSRWR